MNLSWSAPLLPLFLATTSLLGQGYPSATIPHPPTSGHVTSHDLLAGLSNPERWLTYSGDYTGQRHSPLTQITPQNVWQLSPQWTFQTNQSLTARGMETTPIVLDGVLYATGAFSTAWAIDARTGRQIWRYQRSLPEGMTVCCGPMNRGFGILGDKLFLVTLDARLLALNRTDGKVLYEIPMADFKGGYSGSIAPLVVGDKVIVGISGSEFPMRGFVEAYQAETGKLLWRTYTIPGPGEPGSETWPNADVMARGGGGVWVTGTHDPAANLVYFGTSNPNPDYYGDDRAGDNLYTNSLLAIDPDTGKIRWYFQFTPHDTHDWDASHIPVLADLTFAGKPRNVVMMANRNGFFYVLDRLTGELLLGKPYTDTKWARELDSKGRPIVLNELGTEDACLPDNWGGTVFNPPSFDPKLGLFFVNARETCAIYNPVKPPQIKAGLRAMGGQNKRLGTPWGALRAIDPVTGQRKWESEHYTSPSMAGVLSTASGLVFTGDHEGNFYAIDSRTGKRLWQYQTGSTLWGLAPMTYMLDGRQFVFVPSGSTMTVFALPAARPR